MTVIEKKARQPLTETKLRAVRATGKRFELTDRHGLALRVGLKGDMVWSLTYSVLRQGNPSDRTVRGRAGPRKRMTLGTYPAITLAEARARALAARSQARQGIDPAAASRAEAAAAEPAVTVGDLIKRYVTGHLRPNLRSAYKVETILQRHVAPAWGDRSVSEIGRSDLVRLLEAVRKRHNVQVTATNRGSYTAKRGGIGAALEVRKWVGALFQYALDVDLRSDNPFLGFRSRDRANTRDRVLSMPELRAVWCAAQDKGYPWGPYFLLLMLTGNRRGEWAAARWEWLDESWLHLEIPPEHYKTSRPHVVPLAPIARAIVSNLPAPTPGAGSFLFSSDGGGSGVAGFSDAKRFITTRAEYHLGAQMQPWVTHDLRRSMATHMERLGVAPHVIEACLGHVLKGVQGTYRRYNLLPEKLDALRRWEDELARHLA